MRPSDARQMFNEVVSPGDMAVEMSRISGGGYDFSLEQGHQMLEFLINSLADEPEDEDGSDG